MSNVREQKWREKVALAKLSAPKDYLKDKKKFDQVIKRNDGKINKNLAKENSVFANNTKENWDFFVKDMWKKKNKVFTANADKGVPNWFLNKKIPELVLDHKFPDYTNMKRTKILIIGDTHTNFEWIKLIKKIKPDIVIHTGDFEHFGNPDVFFPFSEKQKYLTYFVNGNHEITNEILRKNHDPKYYLNMFTQYKIFKIQGKKILLTHFFDEQDRVLKTVAKATGVIFDTYKWHDELITKNKPDIVIAGHTHVAKIQEEKVGNDEYLVLNPGSLVVPREQKENKKNRGTYIIGIAKNGNFKFKIKFFKK